MKKNTKYLLLTFVTLSLIILFFYTNASQEDFNSERWKNWTETEQNLSLRWDMMNSLREYHQLKGLSKNETINLLGIPDNGTSTLQFRYYLGMSKRGVDTGTLVIEFNLNERVSDFYVHSG